MPSETLGSDPPDQQSRFLPFHTQSTPTGLSFYIFLASEAKREGPMHKNPKPSIGSNKETSNMASHHLISFFFLFSLLQAHGDEIGTVGSTLSSSFPAALQTLQKQIGYQFQTVDLLRRAMTHPSYSRDNNKLLSYLGLWTMQSTASLRFILRDPEMSPKDLNRRITDISREDACAAGATRLGLEKVVRVSAKTDASAPVVLCGAFRALFGAVAVDNGTVDSGGNVFWRVHGSGVGGVFFV